MLSECFLKRCFVKMVGLRFLRSAACNRSRLAMEAKLWKMHDFSLWASNIVSYHLTTLSSQFLVSAAYRTMSDVLSCSDLLASAKVQSTEWLSGAATRSSPCDVLHGVLLVTWTGFHGFPAMDPTSDWDFPTYDLFEHKGVMGMAWPWETDSNRTPTASATVCKPDAVAFAMAKIWATPTWRDLHSFAS